MITEFSLAQSEQWDGIVRSFHAYDVYYLSGYVRAFALNGDGEPRLILWQNGEARAIQVVLLRDISLFAPFCGKIAENTCFDFSTPYGYGGFLAESCTEADFAAEYTAFCREKGVISEFVRFHPLLGNQNGAQALYEVTDLGNTVFMDTSSPETIWNGMTSKNRNMIRKAQKSGLQVYWRRDPGMIEPFMALYGATMDKDHAADYYYFDRSFYESILNDLKYNALWFCAELSGTLAACAIILFCNGKMHYHLSASKRELQGLAPTNLLLYEAAMWGAENGFSKFHLGGGVGSAHDGLYQFKKAFNRGEDTVFSIGRCIFDEARYQELVALRQGTDPNFDAGTSFFPAYRG